MYTNPPQIIISRTKPFTLRQRRWFCHQDGFGHRPVNNWGDGDLPAPWAEGDLVRLAEVGSNDRLYGMGPGYFVVTAVFSIDDGDAWYVRVTNDKDRGSDRLHIAYSQRCSWAEDCDWMAGFELIETSDPDGLKTRETKLAQGWVYHG